MKKLKYLLFSIVLALAISGFFPTTKNTSLNALYNGDMINNVIYVSFADGDNDWILDTPYGYESNVKTIMENSYNASNSSVNEYYKTMSYNKLNLTSNFYYANSNSTSTFTVPYTENELLTYSKTNPNGYLKYEVCTYTGSSAPSFLSLSYLTGTTHQFSCYDCGNSSYSGTSYYCDMDISDDIACYCKAVEYTDNNSNSYIYSHLEEYIREQIALKSVLKQISSFEGNIDSNNDGNIDAMTFIFPNSEDVGWSDLLWAHQLTIINLSDYLPSYILNYINLFDLLQGRGVRGETEGSISLMLEDIKISNKICADYNLYLLSDLVNNYTTNLHGDDGKELGVVFTMAHELGHILGLPDYYTYIEETGEVDPVEEWDLMSYAINNVPTYLTTYNREILGFTNTSNIKKLTTSGTYTLKPTCYDEMNNNNNNSNNVLAYVLEDPSFENQKIYIEYRYKGGKFEPAYSSKQNGLIIYRVDNNVKPMTNYEGMLSSGNFGGYPYNMYVFRNNRTNVFNDTYNSYGNSNLNLTSNVISFQTYDKSKPQEELELSDITYTNSGIVIENITINTQTNEISFDISGGYLQAPLVDLSSVQLNGDTNIIIEYGSVSAYEDAGIDFAEYEENDFIIKITNQVDLNIVDTYTYKYNLTHIESGETLELTRTINVVDTIKPTVTLIGDAVIELLNINDYEEPGINYYDNYNSNQELIVEISAPVYNPLTELWVVTYKVIDESNNTTIITRNIKVTVLDFTNVKLIGSFEVKHEVKTPYTDLGITFGAFNENEFEVLTSNSLNENVLGTYTYTYNLTHIQSGHNFTLTRTIHTVDTIAPLITLIGGNIIEFYDKDFSNFVEPGYETTDNYDTNLQTIVTNRIITNTELNITYYAIDSSSNETTVTRIVRITKKPINIHDNQITLTINNNKNDKFFTNSTIELKVNFILLPENDPNVTIKFYINNQQIISYIENTKTVSIKINEAGIYNVKVIVSGATITRQIVVNDIIGKSNEQKALITIIIIFPIVLLGVISIIILKNRAKKIKNRLDKY